MSYQIRNIQEKSTVEENLPTLAVVSARLKDRKPSCWKGYHPFVVGTFDPFLGFQPLSVEEEERLADLTGYRVSSTGVKSPFSLEDET